MRPDRRLTSRRLGASRGSVGRLLLATLIALAAAVSPGLTQPVLAAGDLIVSADTVYTVDPEAERVHVAIAYTITNNKPNVGRALYYYRGLTAGIQPDVRAIRATDRTGTLTTSTTRHADYTQVDVRLRSNLYYRQSTTLTLRYDLVGAPPRSRSPIRVGQAFAAFGVWAFGDPGQGSVEVRLPSGFASSLEGDDLPRVSGGVGTGTVLRASPARPDDFFTIVSAENSARYDSSRLSLPGGIEVVVLSWPEDRAWRDSVTATLRTGIPRLVQLIGLDWPVFRDLNVRERYTPALEGYAGLFLSDAQRIDMSEDLDPITTLHEASHAWFNETLFSERWITEGLAEEYADRVHAAGGGTVEPPVAPKRDDPAYVALNTWTFPAVVKDDTDAREHYGYGASAWLVHEIVEQAGVDQMRRAFQLAHANLTAYPGAGDPEHVAVRDSWRRFLDLTEPIDQPDPQAVLDAVQSFVVAPGDEAALAARADARTAYRSLLEAGDGWLPPWFVREPMGEWRFVDAEARIQEAAAVLDLRDQVAAAAGRAGLTLDDDLRNAYENAETSLDEPTALAKGQLEAIAAIEATGARLAVAPDLVATIGLLGETPETSYEAAREAFEGGDVAAARDQATAAAAVLDRATVVGQERLIMAGIVIVAVGGMLLLIAGLRRRRGRRHAAAAAHIDAAPIDAAVADAQALLALDAGPAPGPPRAEDVPIPAGDSTPPPEGGPTPPGAVDGPHAATEASAEPQEPSATLLAHPEATPSPLDEGPRGAEEGEAR